MRHTPLAMIILGALLLIQSIFFLGDVYWSARHTAQVLQTVRRVEERMSREEIARVFDMPPETADMHKWLAFYVGGRQEGSDPFGISFLEMFGLGIALIVWGVLERTWRKDLWGKSVQSAATS